MIDKPSTRKPSDINSIIRTGLAAIPTIGGVMATAWSEWESKNRFNRIETAINELGETLNKLKHFDPKRIGPAEIHFFHETLRRIEEEHREEKRRLFIQLLANYWAGTKLSFDEAMIFNRALYQFSEIHIHILKFLCAANRKPSYSELAYAFLEVPDNSEQRATLTASLNSLAGDFGFINRAWGLSDGTYKGAPLGTKNLSPEGITRKCEHEITTLGKKFLQAIEEQSTSDQ